MRSHSKAVESGLQYVFGGWGTLYRLNPSLTDSPVSFPAEPGGRSAQGEAGPGLRGEVGRQPDHGGSSPAPDAMPQVRGLPADGVRRVPLLQGHEEVRGPRADEAELHHAAVHCGECARGCASLPTLTCGAGIRPHLLHVGPVSAVPPLTVWPQQKSRRGSSSWKEGGTSAVSRLLAAGQQDGSTMRSGSFSFIVRWSYNSFLPSMTQYFEVAAIKNVGAACPVCDPVANVYGSVHDGCGPSLPSCPAFKVRGLGGRSAPLLRGPSQRNRTDL